MGATSERTVFVLGVTQRVGTHFLESLLSQHPHATALVPPRVNPRATFEDYVLEHADLLDQYVSRTQAHWDPRGFGGDRQLGDRMRGTLGDGTLAALEALLPAGPVDRVLVARTPSIGRLDLLPSVFPGSKAIVIVRDPRTTVESAVRSFGAMGRSTRPAWEGWAERWAKGVRQFLDASAGLSLLQLESVRYEDLQARRDEILVRLLEFAGLDRERYPFESLDDLPVLGSSQAVAAGGRLHWDRATSPTSAELRREIPVWPEKDLQRLAQLAGPEMAAMGYALDVDDPGGSRWRGTTADLLRSGERLARRAIGRPWPD